MPAQPVARAESRGAGAADAPYRPADRGLSRPTGRGAGRQTALSGTLKAAEEEARQREAGSGLDRGTPRRKSLGRRLHKGPHAEGPWAECGQSKTPTSRMTGGGELYKCHDPSLSTKRRGSTRRPIIDAASTWMLRALAPQQGRPFLPDRFRPASTETKVLRPHAPQRSSRRASVGAAAEGVETLEPSRKAAATLSLRPSTLPI